MRDERERAAGLDRREAVRRAARFALLAGLGAGGLWGAVRALFASCTPGVACGACAWAARCARAPAEAGHDGR